MFERVGKQLTRLFRHLMIRHADHEFIIDAQAARIEIRGADVNDIVENQEFGMQDLRLILVNSYTRFEQSPVYATPCQLRQHDV